MLPVSRDPPTLRSKGMSSPTGHKETRLAELRNRATLAEGQAKVHEERVSGLFRERESLDVRTREARAEAAELKGRLETGAAEREAAARFRR